MNRDIDERMWNADIYILHRVFQMEREEEFDISLIFSEYNPYTTIKARREVLMRQNIRSKKSRYHRV